MKICSCCKVEKPLEEFYLRSDRPGKRASHCRLCKKQASKTPKLAARRKERQKGYRKNNFQKERARVDAWIDKNRARVNQCQLKNTQRRRKSDPAWAIRLNLSTRISKALRGKQKALPTLTLLGCSLEELRRHLEKQFLPGMSWENYGKEGWHVDHKRPCASFSDLTRPEQQRECFRFSNLQPLWSTDNYKKGAKWEE